MIKEHCNKIILQIIKDRYQERKVVRGNLFYIDYND